MASLQHTFEFVSKFQIFSLVMTLTPGVWATNNIVISKKILHNFLNILSYKLLWISTLNVIPEV